jgi:hypothetical protein
MVQKNRFTKNITKISGLVWLVCVVLFFATTFAGADTNGLYKPWQNIAFIITLLLGVIAFLVLIASLLLKTFRDSNTINFKKVWKAIFLGALVIYGVVVIVATGRLTNVLVELKNERYESTKTIGTADMIALVNKERAAHGLRLLKENSLLDASAKAKSCDMVAKGYFDHYDPQGRSPWHFFREAGYGNYTFAGENLVTGYFGDQESMRRLMLSPEHKENILDPNYTEVGIGKCGDYTTQHFGSR